MKSIIQFMFCAAALAASTTVPAKAALSQNQAFEILFMEDMIDHHSMGVDMAKLCPSRASNAELLAMCNDIIRSQRAEIAKIQGWLKEWYGEPSVPHKTEQSMSDLEHLASLSGSEFEQQFMEHMSGHHMVALENSAECLLRTSHSALTNLCGEMIRTQVVEIQMMRRWLCQWYQACSLHVMRGAMVGVPKSQQ